MSPETATPAERFGPENSMPADEKIFTLSEIGVLTERQAEAYVYRRIEKYDRERAADEMGVSTSTVDDYERAAAEKLTNAEETVDRLFDLGWWQGPITVIYGFGDGKARERFVNQIISGAPAAEVFVMCDYRMPIRDTLDRMFDDAVAGELDVDDIRAELPDEWVAEHVEDDNTVPFANAARLIEEHAELIAAAHLGPAVDPGGESRDEVVTSEEPPISGAGMLALSASFAAFIDNRIQNPENGVVLARGDSRMENHLTTAISTQLRVETYDESREEVSAHPLTSFPVGLDR